MKKIVIIPLLIIIFITSYSNKKLVFPKQPADLNTISILVLQTAYEKIGYELELIIMPPKRAIHESNSGRIDGETHRIKGIEKKFENLILIDVPINWFELRLFSKKYDFYIEDIAKLKSYIFGARRGVLIFENTLRGFPNVIYANDSKLSYERLEAERIDFILETDIEFKLNKYRNVQMLEPALRKLELYHYLHKKNAHLVPEITKVLIEMKASGEIKKIRDDYIKNFE